MKIKLPNPELKIDTTSFLKEKLQHYLSLDDSLNDLLPSLQKFYDNGLVPNELISRFQSDSYQPSSFAFHILRESMIGKFGFSLLSEPLVDELARQLRYSSVVEVGAGTGFLTRQLLDRKINITGLDIEETQTSSYHFHYKHAPIIPADGRTFLSHTHPQCVILSWPNYDSEFATEILQQLKFGQRLYYMGEWESGCTASDSFFDLLEQKATLHQKLTRSLQAHNLSWPAVHDKWCVFDISEKN